MRLFKSDNRPQPIQSGCRERSNHLQMSPISDTEGKLRLMRLDTGERGKEKGNKNGCPASVLIYFEIPILAMLLISDNAQPQTAQDQWRQLWALREVVPRKPQSERKDDVKT